MRIFEGTSLVRFHLLVIDPESNPQDELDSGADESVWLAYQGLHTRSGLAQMRSLTTVRKAILPLLAKNTGEPFTRSDAELLADVHIRSALTHPESPFGLGIGVVHWPMHVVFRRGCFTRDRRGVLTPQPDCGCAWSESMPTPEVWRLTRDLVLHHAKCEGWLP